MLAYACQLLQILLLFKNDVTFKSINLQTNKRYLQYCPFIVSLECTNKAKKPRFFKGLVTSPNIGSLLLFFAYGGLPRGKKFLRIWTASIV